MFLPLANHSPTFPKLDPRFKNSTVLYKTIGTNMLFISRTFHNPDSAIKLVNNTKYKVSIQPGNHVTVASQVRVPTFLYNMLGFFFFLIFNSENKISLFFNIRNVVRQPNCKYGICKIQIIFFIIGNMVLLSTSCACSSLSVEIPQLSAQCTFPNLRFTLI